MRLECVQVRLVLQNNLNFLNIFINKTLASLQTNACSDGHFYRTGEMSK